MTLRSWPGLIDLQVNGFGGWDVNAEDVSPDTIAALTRALWCEGVTRYLPTVISAESDRILHALDTIARARRIDPLIAHSIVGVHVEGPYLSAEEGVRGAHDPHVLRDPDTEELERWCHAADGLIRIVTLAPERPGSVEYIRDAVSRGIRVSLGHTAADAAEIRTAVTAGATLSTHLGNGAAVMLPRHPNHIWAQLAADELTAMLILDGHHLPSDTAIAMVRAKGVDRVIMTSDAAALAGMPPGEYVTPVGGHVRVETNGRLALPGSEMLAGSGHSLRQCLEWAWRTLPFPLDDLVRMASAHPARALGLPPDPTDLIDVDIDDGIRIRRVVVAGHTVFEQDAAA